MLTKNLFILMFAFSVAIAVQAQTFEIRTVNRGFGVIGVQVRNTSAVPVTNTEFITDIVFGIKWKTGYNVDLASSLSSSYNIKKSGLRVQKDSFYFQAFYADNTPYQMPENWDQNTWIDIMSVTNTLTGTDTGTFLICEQDFDATTNPNIGINLSDYSPAVNGDATGVVLPVNLLSFSVMPVNNTIRLNWSTTSEINSKGFEVQRSEGNTLNFIAVGFVNSKSSNSQRNNYDFTDNKVSAGTRYYYRLRQVDMAGNSRLSDIKDAILDRNKGALLQLTPNPAKDIITILFSAGCATKPVNIQITDGKGSVVNAWKEVMQASKKIDYNISALTAGQYFLTVKDESSLVYKTSFQKL